MARSPIARVLLPLLFLTLIVIVTFGGAIKNSFVNWDDQKEISENPHFNPVTLHSLAWNWNHTELSLYMPVTYMVWGGVAKLAGRDNPRAFHALNVVLHLICTGLVFALILQLWRRTVPALIGALVFAVHPLQVEPVAWASGMYTLLSTVFSLAAILAYVGSATRKSTSVPSAFVQPVLLSANDPGFETTVEIRATGRAILFFWIATFFYILALLTKAASVSVPFAALVIDVLILGRPLQTSIRSLMLWMLLAIPIVFIAKSFQDVTSISVPSLWARPVVALDAIGFYLSKIILPMHLIPDYGRNPAWVMRHGIAVMVSAGAAIMAILLAFIVRRNAAWITAGLALLLAGIGPYLGLTAFDFQYVSTVADRYAYLGMVGIALLAAGAAMRSRLAMVVIVLVVIVCIPVSRRQVSRWADTDTLFNYTLKVNPVSLVSHNVFGYLAAKRGEFKTAESNYKQGLDVWPQDATVHFNLANLYFRQASKSPSQRNQLLNQALEHYSLAVKYQPNYPDFRNGLAATLASVFQLNAAEAQWQVVLSQDPTDVNARNNLADMLANMGRIGQAREQYQAVLQVDPDNAHATHSLRDLARN
jgi:tetratricopeptide (TPR) repeat protein